MIIFSGFGFLIAVFVFGCSLLANIITNHVTGSEEYWEMHKWPLGVSMLVSALLSWTVGKWLARFRTRVLIDKETGEEVRISPRHTLFFIKMHWWGPILCAIGIFLIARDLMV